MDECAAIYQDEEDEMRVEISEGQWFQTAKETQFIEREKKLNI